MATSAGVAGRIRMVALPAKIPKLSRTTPLRNAPRRHCMDLHRYIRDIPDFPKPGILFKDITPLLSSPLAFHQAIHRMVEHYLPEDVDVIAAAEARGFLFAAPLAIALNKPLVPLRKPGKLPYLTHTQQYALEYSSAELHVHTDG